MRMALKTQAFLGISAIAVCVVAIGALAMTSSRLLQQASQAVLQENVSSLKAAEELELALLDQKGLVSSYLLSGDEQWLRLLDDKRANFDQWFRKAQAVATTQREREILARIRADYAPYDRARLQVVQLYQQGRIGAAEQLLLRDVRLLLDQIYSACEELLLVNEQLIAESQRTTAARVRRLQGIIWTMVVGAIGVGLALGWWVTRSVARRLVQSEKLAALGQVASVVAHEVRNPLTAIKLRLHSLQTELQPTPTAREDLDIIAQEIQRLEGTVHDVLAFAKPPAVMSQPLQLHEVVDSCLRFMEAAFAERRIAVMREYATAAPRVAADPAQLKQVFLNLFLNAADAMPAGGTLRVSLRQVKSLVGKPLLEVAVADSGGGIPSSVRRRLFEPFVTTKAEGTGLGLAVARAILERHEGQLLHDARSGTGARFLVQLPVAEGVP